MVLHWGFCVGSDVSTLLDLSGISLNAAAGRYWFVRTLEPLSCFSTQLILSCLSLQGWERLVVGAYNCAAHWRTARGRGVQDHGGNAPPLPLRGAQRGQEGGVGTAGETRKHLHQLMCHRLPLTGSTQGVPHPRGKLAAGTLCHIKAL